MRVATHSAFKGRDGSQQTRTEWWDCVAKAYQSQHGLLAAARNARSGDNIYCEGRGETREWQGRDGGTNRRFEIICHGGKNGQVIFLGKGDRQTNPLPVAEDAWDNFEDRSAVVLDDNIPF
jgi:single-stranded DNA-binding protein